MGQSQIFCTTGDVQVDCGVLPQKHFHDRGEPVCVSVFDCSPQLIDSSQILHDPVRKEVETPKTSHGMDDWVFDAVAGRNITMLVKSANSPDNANGSSKATCKMSKPSSILYLNISLSLMTIQPINFSECPTITIEIDSIKAISSISVLVPSLIHQREVRSFAAALDKKERGRAIVIQFVVDQHNEYVYFLETSVHARDLFIQELTGIKIERRHKCDQRYE